MVEHKVALTIVYASNLDIVQKTNWVVRFMSLEQMHNDLQELREVLEFTVRDLGDQLPWRPSKWMMS